MFDAQNFMREYFLYLNQMGNKIVNPVLYNSHQKKETKWSQGK